MEVLIMKIELIPALNERYRDNKQNIRELTDILKKVVHIFKKIYPKQFFSRFGQLSWQSFIKEAQTIKYVIPIRNRNQTEPAPTMFQPQEETKEEMERVSLFEGTKEEIHFLGEEIDEEITEERQEKIRSLMEDAKEETIEERKEESHLV